jgi:hypothetical protein
MKSVADTLDRKTKGGWLLIGFSLAPRQCTFEQID